MNTTTSQIDPDMDIPVPNESTLHWVQLQLDQIRSHQAAQNHKLSERDRKTVTNLIQNNGVFALVEEIKHYCFGKIGGAFFWKLWYSQLSDAIARLKSDVEWARQCRAAQKVRFEEKEAQGK